MKGVGKVAKNDCWVWLLDFYLLVYVAITVIIAALLGWYNIATAKERVDKALQSPNKLYQYPYPDNDGLLMSLFLWVVSLGVAASVHQTLFSRVDHKEELIPRSDAELLNGLYPRKGKCVPVRPKRLSVENPSVLVRDGLLLVEILVAFFVVWANCAAGVVLVSYLIFVKLCYLSRSVFNHMADKHVGVWNPSRTLFLNSIGYMFFLIGFAALHRYLGAIAPWQYGGNYCPNESFSTAIYFSGVTILTIGYGDIYPTGCASRTLTLFEGLTGLFQLVLVIQSSLNTHLSAGSIGGRGRGDSRGS